MIYLPTKVAAEYISQKTQIKFSSFELAKLSQRKIIPAYMAKNYLWNNGNEKALTLFRHKIEYCYPNANKAWLEAEPYLLLNNWPIDGHAIEIGQDLIPAVRLDDYVMFSFFEAVETEGGVIFSRLFNFYSNFLVQELSTDCIRFKNNNKKIDFSKQNQEFLDFQKSNASYFDWWNVEIYQCNDMLLPQRDISEYIQLPKEIPDEMVYFEKKQLDDLSELIINNRLMSEVKEPKRNEPEKRNAPSLQSTNKQESVIACLALLLCQQKGIESRGAKEITDFLMIEIDKNSLGVPAKLVSEKTLKKYIDNGLEQIKQ